MTATILPFVRPAADAIMALHAQVPPGALTAALLGTRRAGHAIQVREDGLLLAMGYTVLEASEIWLSNRRGQSSQAVVLAHDFNSGLAVLKPAVPLGRHSLDMAGLDDLREGDAVDVLTSQSDKPMGATVFALQEFAGRWEYLLERAIYTVPLCEEWSGAALLDKTGRLLGVGSLALGLSGLEGRVLPGNLFVPVELIMDHLDYMAEHGEPPTARRPWLGLLAEEHEAELYVVGVYGGAPAARAGLKPGDVILSVRHQPVASLAGLFRSLWRSGPAGVPVSLTIRDGDEIREVLLHSTDRNSFFLQRERTADA